MTQIVDPATTASVPYWAVVEIFLPRGVVGEQFSGSVAVTNDGALLVQSIDLAAVEERGGLGRRRTERGRPHRLPDGEIQIMQNAAPWQNAPVPMQSVHGRSLPEPHPVPVGHVLTAAFTPTVPLMKDTTLSVVFRGRRMLEGAAAKRLLQPPVRPARKARRPRRRRAGR